MSNRAGWFLRTGKLTEVARSLRLTPKGDTANQPPFLARAADVAIETVPFSRKWMPTVLAAWAVAPILLWTNGFTIPEAAAVDAPPVQSRGWIYQVRESWELPVPPQQARRFVPQGAVAAGKTPYARTALNNSLAAWEVGQPPIQKRYGQIVSVDDPVFGQRSVPEAVRQAWQPDTWEAQAARHTPLATAAAAADQPPGSRAWITRAVASWTQDPVLIWQNGFLAQDGVVADSPIGLRAWFATVRQAWEPEAYPPQGWKHLVQAAAAAVNDPPFGLRAWFSTVRNAWEPAPYSIQVTEKAVQPAAVVSEQPFGKRERLSGLIAAWEQTLVPLWGAAGVQSPDNPIFSGRPWLAVTLRAWEPEWIRPQVGRRLAQPTAVAQDSPPVSDRPWLDTITRAWEPAPYPPQGWRHLVQPPVVAADNPPFGLRPWLVTIRQSWEPEWIRSQTGRVPVQAGAPAVEKTPYARPWIETIRGAWEPWTITAQGRRYVVQKSAAATTPPHARPWLATVRSAWESGTIIVQGRRTVVQPTVVAADNPPFGLRPWLASVRQSWEPEWGRPQTGRVVVHAGTMIPVIISRPSSRTVAQGSDGSRSGGQIGRRPGQTSKGRRT